MMALFHRAVADECQPQISEAVAAIQGTPTGTAKQLGSDWWERGKIFVVNKDILGFERAACNKPQMLFPISTISKNHIDMTGTNDGLRIGCRNRRRNFLR